MDPEHEDDAWAAWAQANNEEWRRFMEGDAATVAKHQRLNAELNEMLKLLEDSGHGTDRHRNPF